MQDVLEVREHTRATVNGLDIKVPGKDTAKRDKVTTNIAAIFNSHEADHNELWYGTVVAILRIVLRRNPVLQGEQTDSREFSAALIRWRSPAAPDGKVDYTTGLPIVKSSAASVQDALRRNAQDRDSLLPLRRIVGLVHFVKLNPPSTDDVVVKIYTP